MVAACVIQIYIYRLSPCGDDANSCDEPAPINVWVQTIPYVLIGFSEIAASITGLEYACTKAPKNMKSLVMSVFLLTNAVSSAIAQGWVALATDPLLVWNYGSIAVLAFFAGIGFWFTFRQLDRDDDRLNMLKESSYAGRKQIFAGEEESGKETVWGEVKMEK
jgi:POT family proton-dependent oligopeptide transporter